MRASDDTGREVRELLLGRTYGILSTLSVDPRIAGWPFGSVVPFALTARREPVIYIAGIAQHTRNLGADPRASLLVHEPSEGDPQAGWRVTLVGTMQPVGPGEDAAQIEARYRQRVPDAPAYSEAHDFEYWRMTLVRVRYIGGFGRIHWLEPEDVLVEPAKDPLGPAATAIVEHMNADHQDALLAMCAAFQGVHARRARMLEIESAGLLVETQEPAHLVYVAFGREIGPGDARSAMVELTRRAREILSSGER